MPKLCATPYSLDSGMLDAHGKFVQVPWVYFDSPEEYEEKTKKLLTSFGAPIEEFEIQFIDGEALDLILFKYMDVRQYNVEKYFEVLEQIEDEPQVAVKVAALDAEGIEVDPDELLHKLDDVYVFEGTGPEFAQHYAEEVLGFDPSEYMYGHYVDWNRVWNGELRFDTTELRIDDTNYVVEVHP